VDKPTSVDAYLAGLTAEQRSALEGLRTTIAAAAPAAAEGISYSMPAFKVEGRGLVCYAAFTDHYSLFPMSKEVIVEHADELGSRATGKGTIRFEYGERLPIRLVKKIVKARLAEVETERGRHEG